MTDRVVLPDDQLPENPGSFEHLQSVYLPQFNRQVKEYFSDLGDDWQPEVKTPRGRLRSACTMSDADSALTMVLRHNLFYDVLGYGRSNLAIVNGRKDVFDVPVFGKPKIVFYFSQDSDATPDEYSRVEAEHSFRITDELNTTWTESEAKALALKIKNEFVEANRGISYAKGKISFNYFDKSKGYRLRILAQQQTVAVNLIKKLLDLQDVVYDEDKLTVSEPKRNNLSTPQSQVIMGKTYKKKRYRPNAIVRFRYAYAEIPGRTKPLWLVDTTYKSDAFYFPLPV